MSLQSDLAFRYLQCTVSQPGGTDYANCTLMLTPMDFQTFLRPCVLSALQSKSELVMKSMMILTPSSLTCVTQLHKFSTWVKGGGDYVLKCVFADIPWNARFIMGSLIACSFLNLLYSANFQVKEMPGVNK